MQSAPSYTSTSGEPPAADRDRAARPDPTAATPRRGRRVAVLTLLLGLGSLANGALLAIPDPVWATAASLTLTVLVPGGLLALLLVPAEDTEPAEWLIAALGLGLTALIVSGLVLHYLPLPLGSGILLAWFDGLALALTAAILRTRDDGRSSSLLATRCSLALPLVLLLGAALRLPNLGYAEFQGDEAKVVLPAAAVLQDVGDALFYHGKGPAEILVVAVQYGLVGTLSEASARLPFALAAVAGLGVVYLLTRRLLGDVGALVAALLLAFNGYLVAFARIAQYQSLVFLMSALAVWCAVRWAFSPRRPSSAWPVLAGAFVGTGALAHYDAVFALPPIAVLALWRGGVRGLLARGALLGWLAGAAVGLALLLLFFGPYALSPLDYLATERITERIGADFPHINLPKIGASAALYTSLPYLLLVGLLAGLGTAYRVRAIAHVSTRAWLVGLAWFAVPFVFYGFIVREPGTHAHVASTGLALLGGWTTAAIWPLLCGRRWRSGLVGALGALLGLVGAYLAPVYLQTHRELVRGNLEEFGLAWAAGNQAAVAERFGFPYAAGWKVVGQLYADGRLAGSFDSNEKPQITHWYTRGAWHCAEQPRYYLVAENVQDEIEPPRRRVMADYPLIGVVTVGGRPKLRVHERLVISPAEPEIWPLEAIATRFDRDLTGAALDPGVWARGPVAIGHTPAPARFGDAVDLLGYRLLAEDPRPGGTLRLDLFWAPLVSGSSYAVHARLGGDEPLGDDRGPDCDRSDAGQGWLAGQPFVQRTSLSIDADAPPGRHPLMVGVSRLTARGPRLAPSTELPTRDRLVEIGQIDLEARW